jgi:hypothetical protein
MSNKPKFIIPDSATFAAIAQRAATSLLNSGLIRAEFISLTTGNPSSIGAVSGSKGLRKKSNGDFELIEYNGTTWIAVDGVFAGVERLNEIEAGQTRGFISYATKSDMDADTSQENRTVALVANDPTPANNGYYRWDGSSWIKADDLYSNTVDPDNTSEAVTGKAVGGFVLPTRARSEGVISDKRVNLINFPVDEFELGSISLTTGENTSATSRFRTIDFIALLEFNETLQRIRYLAQSGYTIRFVWYDKDKGFISNSTPSDGALVTPPINARYCRFVISPSPDRTLNIDELSTLSISVFYEGFTNVNIQKSIYPALSRAVDNLNLIRNNVDLYRRSLRLPDYWGNGGRTDAGVPTTSRLRLTSEKISVETNTNYTIAIHADYFQVRINLFDRDLNWIGFSAYGEFSFNTKNAAFIDLQCRFDFGGGFDDKEISPLEGLFLPVFITKEINQSGTDLLIKDPDAWEQGGILNSGGENTSTIRIKSDYIEIADSLQWIDVEKDDTYIINVHEYSGTNGQEDHIRRRPGSVSTGRLLFEPNVKFIRITIQFPDDSTITPAEVLNVTDTFITFGNDLNQSGTSAYQNITACAFNVGFFNMGTTPKGVPDEDVSEQTPIWRALLANLGADILLFTEWHDFFDQSETINAYEHLIEQLYPYKFITETSNRTGIFSRIPFVGRTFTSTESGRLNSVGHLFINGEKIGIMYAHLTAGSSAEAINERQIDSQEIIDYFSDYEKVIIAGDFNNTEGASELDIYLNNGYRLSNQGYFGVFDTAIGRVQPAIDNIITKGVNINAVSIDDPATSDHRPIISRLSITKTN